MLRRGTHSLGLSVLLVTVLFLSYDALAEEKASGLPKWTWKRLVLTFDDKKRPDVTVEIRASEGDLYTITPFPAYPPCTGCLTVMDPRGFIHRVIDEGGNNLPGYDWVKGWKILDLPLVDGKQWSYTANLPGAQGTVHLHHSYKVRGLKKIKIQAGEFEAFEVERTTYRSDRGGSTTHKLYYALEPGVTVRLVGDSPWEVKEIQ